jgi:Fic family protein
MQPTDLTPNAAGDLVPIACTLTPTDLLNIDVGGARPAHQAYAFVPNRLPPTIAYDEAMVSSLGRAMLALGRLDQSITDLPNPSILSRSFLRREAVTSSRIEGTRADLSDLVLHEVTGLPDQDSERDAQEVENYLNALIYALDQPEDRSVSISLIRELHQLLLDGVRGSYLEPGQIRTRQNFIGTQRDTVDTARYVPPPPDAVRDLLLDLEGFIDAPSQIPALVRIALVHYQFEAIHPFLDGNGRLGRLLVALLLQRWGIMAYPAVDLSAYVLRHRDQYIDGLLRVSLAGDWRGWITFFLEAFEIQANDAFDRSRRVIALRDHYGQTLVGLLRSSSPDRLLDDLFEHLTITVKRAAELLGVSFTTAQRFVEKLVDLGVLEEMSGRQRDRVYRARQVIAILEIDES